MTQEEIVSLALNKAKEANKKVLKKDYSIGCHDLYHDCCEMAEHISYHAVKGVYPKKLYQHKSPNQTDKEATYIEKNHKQHTLPVFIDYLSTITRPFGDGNWSIDYRADEDAFKTAGQTFQSYVESELPIYGSLENFVKFILPTIKSIDANGFIAVRPKEIEYTENETGEIVIDSEKLYKPTPLYFESKSVVCYQSDEFYLFLSKDYSDVEYGGKREKTGSVFELYTKEAVYFIIQTGRKVDNEFDIQIYYQHNLDECCVHQLMGVPNLCGEEILWQSPFLYSTDILDTVLMNANYLQLSINSCVFPVKVMFGSPCEFRDSRGNICQEGTLHIDGVSHQCPSCNGIGLKSRISPLGTLLLNPSTKFEIGEDKSSQDPLKYISPEVHTLEFLRDKIETDEAKARKILHLQTSNTTVKGSENTTATGVAIDAKAMHAFVKPISDQIFTLYEFCLNCIGLQRYGDAFVAPEMSYPKTFDFKSPEDYLLDVSEAMKANLPPSFIQTVLMQYINSFYGDNVKRTQVFKLVIQADRLFGLGGDEINLQLARGTVAKWEQILHTSILTFINEQDDAFFNKNISEQVIILQDTAKEKQAQIEGKPIDIYTSNENILAQSVGGLTGMIEIVKAVASGLYDLDAAVSLVSQRFGISEDEARKQLGKPQTITSEKDLNVVTQLT